ncbi:hypothetical protein [Paenibacillus humicola]|nr:hypothetical protein [Paenibacillus humicola]
MAKNKNKTNAPQNQYDAEFATDLNTNTANTADTANKSATQNAQK